MSGPGTKTVPWDLWMRQVLAILRLELRKVFLGRRLIAVYFLALAPVFLLAVRATLPLNARELGDLGTAGVVYAGMFQFFLLRFAVFFGCVAIFANLFRGEMFEKTLHYYLLAPVRREVLVVGKYVSGLASAIFVFSTCAAVSYILLYVPYGPRIFQDHFFGRGPGLSEIFNYAAVAALACVGYGAVFLLMGVLFKNPMIPAALVLGWESVNFVLPATLQKISIIHYLQSICPVAIPNGPLAVIIEPTSAWVAVPGMLLVTLFVLAIAGLRIRRLEINYGTE